MHHLPIVVEGSNQASLSKLLDDIADALRAQKEDLDKLHELLEPMLDHASGGVPVHTLDGLFACIERASVGHARTLRSLSTHLTALASGQAPHDVEPARLARLLGRRRFDEETMLGFLDFADRVTAGFAPPQCATAEERSLYTALAEWERRERARLRVESQQLVPLALALEPALGQGARPVSLSVHRREILAHGGCRHEASVFCPVERASVGIDWCRGCPLARGVSPDAVECTPGPTLRAGSTDARLGTDACVGEVMGTRHVSALPEVPASEIARALRETPGALVVVVDDGDRLVGVIEPFVAASAPLGAQAGMLQHDQSSILESASLADAINLMVKAHARAVPVVRSDGRVVGLLADLDALRWVACHPQRRRLSP